MIEDSAKPLAAVIGMGTMGSGIAQALIAGGLTVIALDHEASALDKGVGRIRASLDRRVQQGRLSESECEILLGRLRPTADWDALAEADLVIEAVFEDIPTKRAVLERIEEACSAETLIGSNTSTISLDLLVEGMRHPQRLIGMHFFNPAHRMPLVEIIHRETTPPEVVAAALGVARRLGKTPVLVKNREGFLVNRLLLPYLKETFWLLEEGVEAPAIDGALVEFGFPIGPVALCDMVGLDILICADRVLSRAFPYHGSLSPIALQLVEQGHLGQKAGAGVYRYASGDHTPLPNPLTRDFVTRSRRAQGNRDEGISKEETVQRLVLRMVCEAFRVMEEGIVQRESDVDVATVLGIGFPDFRGGVVRYARDLGLDRVVSQLDALAARWGERFLPCSLLRQMR